MILKVAYERKNYYATTILDSHSDCPCRPRAYNSTTVDLRYNAQTHKLHLPTTHTYKALTESIGKAIKIPEKEVEKHTIEYLARGKIKHVKNDDGVALLMKDYADTLKHKDLLPLSILLLKHQG